METIEHQLARHESFTSLSQRDQIICSLYHIDGIPTTTIQRVKMEHIEAGLVKLGKNICAFSDFTKRIARNYGRGVVASCGGKPLTPRAVQLVSSKVRVTDLPVVSHIVNSLDTLFDPSLSLDDALEKSGLNLKGWKYPISRDEAMFRPRHQTGTGIDKTKKTTVYILKYSKSGKELLKFGVSSDLHSRFEVNRYHNVGWNMELLYSRTFNTGRQAMKIESEIKRTIECGVVTRVELRDGYTETCDVKHYDELIKIIDSH